MFVRASELYDARSGRLTPFPYADAAEAADIQATDQDVRQAVEAITGP